MKDDNFFSPEIIIKAYSLGIFPMAKSHTSNSVSFYEPSIRGIIPLNPPHIPRKLLKMVRKSIFEITINYDFRYIIDGCSRITKNRKDTWINQKIKSNYLILHKMGFAHSIEVWDNEKIVGGLYGLSLGSAFFGESMFSEKSNASKVALTHLIYILKNANFTLLDAQFPNEHLKQFGLIEIKKREFKELLSKALMIKKKFPQEVYKFHEN